MPPNPPRHTSQSLLLEGPDAIAFAQAQFSCDVKPLGDGHWQFGAWLDAKGRVLALFHLARLTEHRLLVLLRGGDAAILRDGLLRYVLRSRVTLSIPSSWNDLSAAPALPLHTVLANETAINLGCGSYSMRLATANASPTDTSLDWESTQQRDGWAWLPDTAQGKWLPPALSLERLQAVSFSKGCYPGQEIAARLHWRGGHKWHLHTAQLSAACISGQTLFRDEKEIGQLLDVTNTNTETMALVVLADDIAVPAARLSLRDEQDHALQLSLAHSWPA